MSASDLTTLGADEYVLTDRWKTALGAVQRAPALLARSEDDGALRPAFVLEWHALPAADAPTDARTAAARAQRRFKCAWRRVTHARVVPVRIARDEFGDERAVRLRQPLRWVPLADTNNVAGVADADTKAAPAAPATSVAATQVEDLAVEEMTAEHLPGALILEYELFGEDNSLIADFALGIGRGYCALDRGLNQLVGHVLFEIDPADTILYTSFATSDAWRGVGVAKHMVSSMMQWAFAQPEIVNGRMHVRGGHSQVVGLYLHYGFELIEEDDDDEQEYDDGEPMVTMGGPLRFEVFAKRLGWPWHDRAEFCAQLEQNKSTSEEEASTAQEKDKESTSTSTIKEEEAN